ncbi:hypothetical protein D3C74_257810 [compost metagenome]
MGMFLFQGLAYPAWPPYSAHTTAPDSLTLEHPLVVPAVWYAPLWPQLNPHAS